MSDDPTVALSVAGRWFTFTERTTCLVGRADDCGPRLPADDMQVSQHHCLFDINPPDVRVRDFGSLNGTFVNGEEIGRRKPGETPEEGARTVFPERDLEHGDEIRLGRTLLRVEIVAGQRVRTRAYCAHCGRDAEQADRNREGDIVCASCRNDPSDLVRELTPGYEVVRELGRGGQGVVYLATHLDTGRQVALKVLLAQIAVQGRARASFLREIESNRALRHPNIVEFYDSGSYGAGFYLACEYCESGSLDDLLVAQGGTLTPDEAVPIVLQMLDGLHHAHTAERGLVHRDIKPSNVLLAGTRLTPVQPFEVEVQGETVAIPSRIYNEEPEAGCKRSLTRTQQMISPCLYARTVMAGSASATSNRSWRRASHGLSHSWCSWPASTCWRSLT
ncbi:protein kinase [Streptomyces sp. NPDC002838]|uniref:protein kinase domain-containing protein n=1 Tax=Streptomyces sp. NPDC002838 TaxID=3154436 RepID=UPI00332E5590